MVEAVIFDMDGTLLNTLEDLKESTNFALSKFNFPTRTLEEVRNFVGNGVRLLIERSVPKNTDDKIIENCICIFKEHYAKNMHNHTAPYNSIIEILTELKTDGIKIGVVSNKFDLAVKELCEKYFNNLIDISIGQADDIPPKPAPNGVFKVLNYLDVKTAVFVGDSDVDIQTAKNSNLKSIGVTWGFRDKNNLIGADYIINSPKELLKTIRSL